MLGYDPGECYTGRSPLEAGSIGIDMKDTDVSFRCNLVTLSDEAEYSDKTILDYCADDISTDEARVLVEYLAENLNDDEFTFYSGVSYRHCLIWDKGTLDVGTLTPPHDITGKPIKEYVPAHQNAQKLYSLMKRSYDLLKDHPVNKKREERGLRPANSIWLWGEGVRADLKDFKEKFGGMPTKEQAREIAEIISWNFWQMDGLKGVIPNTCHEEKLPSLFGDEDLDGTPCPGCANDDIRQHNGNKCKIMDWEKGKPILYIDLIKR